MIQSHPIRGLSWRATCSLVAVLDATQAIRPQLVRADPVPAAVTTSCGDLDFNNDGLLPDAADLDDFKAVMAGGPSACSTGNCDTIDFNRDGIFPDAADLDAFLRVLAGGGCRTYVMPDGWSEIQQAPDARVVYVSSSLGNNNNDGLSEAAPLRTPSAAYSIVRDGYPDRVLFRAGDVWIDTPIANSYGGWDKGGRSADEPMVFGVYGDGSRPQLVLTGSGSVLNLMGRDGPDYNGRITIVGLHLINRRTDRRVAATGLRSYGGGSSIYIEDCVIEGFSGGVDFQGVDGIPLRGVTFRRCVVADSAPGDGHSQGMYFSKVESLKVEECVVDHCGWTTPDTQTIFNHGFYVQPSCRNVVVRASWISRSSATGIQLRGQFQSAVGNVLLDNPLGISVGHGQAATPSQDWTGIVAGNVIEGGGDINREPRGMAITVVRANGGRVTSNLITNITGGSRHVFWFPGDTKAEGGNKEWTIEGNVAYAPAGRFYRIDPGQPISLPAIGENLVSSDVQPAWGDRPKSIHDYARTLGYVDAWSMVANMRTRQRGAWDRRLSAGRIAEYMRASYGIGTNMPTSNTR